MFTLTVTQANILSLKDVAAMEGARITMDTLKERVITVHYMDKAYRFKEHKEGLYYLDINNIKYNTEVSPYYLLNSVKDNTLYYSENNIK